MADLRLRAYTRHSFTPVALAILALIPVGARAQLVITDSLTGTASSYNWQSLNGACLTAGTYSASSTSSIPGCTGLPYYTGKTLVGGVTGRLPDAVGQGALRLTNGDTTLNGGNGNNQTGAVVSNFTFPSGQGLQVTFTTVTYGGNGYNNSGADGITFFLMDGARQPNIGAYGGSLGYSCSNNKEQADGVLGGYIGLGIDEFGNFSNPSDTTASGPGFIPGSIALRGAGSVTWGWLNATYPSYFPSTLSSAAQAAAVRNVCATGKIPNGTSVPDYPLLARTSLSSAQPIYNQQGVNMPMRGRATPITYSLSITQAGLLNLSFSYGGGTAVPLMTNQSITSLNGALPSNFRFGFSSGTGGGSNVHEITCFKAAQLANSSSSAGSNAQQAARVQAGTQVYLAYYHSTNSWGQLTAQSLVTDPATDTVSLNSVANWDASCVLTGGSCTATGGNNTAQGPGKRTLLTWSGSGGVPLQWDSLNTAQKAALTAGESSNSSRLDYLRGDRSKEIGPSGTGTFRARSSVLGDIMNASPAWVGPPSLSYSGTWRDKLYPSQSAPESGYATFKTNNATRMNVVYVGANDGLLHGFRAGGMDANGKFTTAPHLNDGAEVLGYMPSQVLNTIHSTTAGLDFSSASYSHNAYVDTTPGTGDIFYKGAWRTWVVGGLGAGGNPTGVIGDKTSVGTGTVYALDVTNPSAFAESNASTIVVGEVNSSTITCTSANGATAACGSNLGNTYGTPLIRRLHNGQWALIFGNGYNSSAGEAGIFVMSFDPGSGAATTRFLGTGYGPSRDPAGANAKNGIAYVSSSDLDADHITDYVYAGDVFGNVWRFDLTSSTASSWRASTAPVYSTGGLPITSRITVSSAVSQSGLPRVMLNFGTGQQLPQTLSSAASYASGQQALFGIWDADMAAWNALSTAQYFKLDNPGTVSTTNLRGQSMNTYSVTNGEISGIRTVSRNAVCWKGTSTCEGGSSANTDRGWKLPLPGVNEQVIYNPVVNYGLMLVNTLIPPVNQPLSCSTQVASGYTMAVSAETGAGPAASFFADASNNYVDVNNYSAAGLGLSAVGSPTPLNTNRKTALVQQNTKGTGVVIMVNPPVASIGKRLNWIRLR